MKLCIKNNRGDEITLEVLKTNTIGEIISMLYSGNPALKKHITPKNYECCIELRLNGVQLASEKMLAHYDNELLIQLIEEEGDPSTCDLIISVKEGVRIQGFNDSILTALVFEAPDVPEHLLCFLTKQIFRIPVRLPCGIIAEQGFILQWTRDNQKCPYTRQQLLQQDVLKLEVDDDTRRQVKEFFQLHKVYPYYNELEQQQYPKALMTFTAPPALRHTAADPDADDHYAISQVLHSDRVQAMNSSQRSRRTALSFGNRQLDQLGLPPNGLFQPFIPNTTRNLSERQQAPRRRFSI